MIISELIEKLEQQKAEHGDISVFLALIENEESQLWIGSIYPVTKPNGSKILLIESE